MLIADSNCYPSHDQNKSSDSCHSLAWTGDSDQKFQVVQKQELVKHHQSDQNAGTRKNEMTFKEFLFNIKPFVSLGRQNERNSSYVRLAHTSIFGLVCVLCQSA